MKSLKEIFPEPPDDLQLAAFDRSRVPAHVAVIMDGNGRWAKRRTLARLRGHEAGITAVRETIRTCSDLGVGFLTIYSFSTENWKRPIQEVDGLMDLFARTMLAELDGLHAENVRVMTIGEQDRLPKKTQEAFAKASLTTRNNTGLTLVVAVNYGARREIARAIARWMASDDFSTILRDRAAGSIDVELPIELVEKALTDHLDTAGIPDPDLVIRTSGESRLSNFLLWQAAYAEFVVSDVLWPDFDRYELLRCLLAYQQRQRRFGGVELND